MLVRTTSTSIYMHRLIWIAQGKPTAAVPVTAAHLTMARESIAIAISIHELYYVITHGCDEQGDAPMLRFRTSDFVTVREMAAAMPANGAAYLTAADALWANVSADSKKFQRLVAEAGYLPMMLVANALHRSAHKGHN
jgi:hypothetical protein